MVNIVCVYGGGGRTTITFSTEQHIGMLFSIFSKYTSISKIVIRHLQKTKLVLFRLELVFTSTCTYAYIHAYVRVCISLCIRL